MPDRRFEIDLDRWFGEFHVRVADDDGRAGHRLHEVRHAVHHFVRGVASRAVINQQNRLQRSCSQVRNMCS